jgi:hypothetical protein
MTTPTTPAPEKPAETEALQKTPVRMGFALSMTIDEGWRLAQAFARSELVPKTYRGHPDDCLVAMQMGMELGLSPMQALSSIAVINGRGGLWGDGLLAVIVASPLYVSHDEYYEVGGQRRDGLVPDDWKSDTTVAVCTFTRRGRPQPTTRRFTVGQAKKAGLTTKDGTWQTYPDRMLAMRARGFAARDTFPDLLRGIKTAEELLDTPADSDPLPVVREVTRASDAMAFVPEEDVPAAAPIVVEPPVIITLDPLTVRDVESFLGGYTVTLGNGMKVDVTEQADAVELEKFKGTPRKVRLTVRRVVDTLQLDSFAIAD